MGNPREKDRRSNARTVATSSHDQLIVNLVTLLARAAAHATMGVERMSVTNSHRRVKMVKENGPLRKPSQFTPAFHPTFSAKPLLRISFGSAASGLSKKAGALRIATVTTPCPGQACCGPVSSHFCRMPKLASSISCWRKPLIASQRHTPFSKPGNPCIHESRSDSSPCCFSGAYEMNMTLPLLEGAGISRTNQRLSAKDNFRVTKQWERPLSDRERFTSAS
jgi:hypothetical protein